MLYKNLHKYVLLLKKGLINNDVYLGKQKRCKQNVAGSVLFQVKIMPQFSVRVCMALVQIRRLHLCKTINIF